MGVHAGNRSRPAYSGQARFQFPPEVTALFKPRRPPPYRPPPRARRRERRRPMSGVAGLVVRFESREDFLARRGGGDRSGGAPSFKTPARKREEARVGAAERVTRRVALVAAARAAEAADAGDGGAGVHEAKRKALTGDAFCTLFVWRLARGTGAAALRADFGVFGRVVRVVVPRDGRGRGRGYAFVEFAAERDVGAAVRGARGRVVDGRRVAVDVERGRTVRGFLPNRLDGPFNSAAAAARRLLGGKSAVAAEARRRLAEGKGAVVVPLYVPPPPPS
jgi:U1 small nuclear ribonucleoprotein 70kDa